MNRAAATQRAKVLISIINLYVPQHYTPNINQQSLISIGLFSFLNETYFCKDCKNKSEDNKFYRKVKHGCKHSLYEKENCDFCENFSLKTGCLTL